MFYAPYLKSFYIGYHGWAIKEEPHHITASTPPKWRAFSRLRLRNTSYDYTVQLHKQNFHQSSPSRTITPRFSIALYVQ
jgi:hypothetical protein